MYQKILASLALLLCFASPLSAAAPASLNGIVFTVTIESGTGDFSSSGQYLFIPARSGSTCTVVFLTEAYYSQGTFTYSTTGENTGSLSVTDPDLQNATTQELVFLAGNTGTFSISNDSGMQTGTFVYEYLFHPSDSNTIGINDLTLRAVGDNVLEFQTTLQETTDFANWDSPDVLDVEIDENRVTWRLTVDDPNVFYRIQTATTIARGLVNGIVKNALTGSPIPDATVRLYSDTNNLLGTIRTDNSGTYSLSSTPGSRRLEVAHDDYVDTEVYVDILSNEAVEADVVLFAEDLPGVAVISGRVINSLTGDGVDEATVTLTPGINNRDGSSILSTTSDSSGDYSFSTVSGSYTLSATADGFAQGFANAAAVGGQTIDNQDIAVSPGLNAGEWRIVLSWGEDPSDLDSHLSGPRDDSGQFHIYYSNKSPDGTAAELDLDDTTSYGPETITIPVLRSGTYRYWVHDYSNRGSTTSTEMSNLSAAKVVVWKDLEGTTVKAAEYNVRSGQVGNAWIVFEIDGSSGTIITRQDITNIESQTVIPLSEKPNGDWLLSPATAAPDKKTSVK